MRARLKLRGYLPPVLQAMTTEAKTLSCARVATTYRRSERARSTGLCDIQTMTAPTFTPRGTVGVVLQRLWRLPLDLARGLVLAQADENRVAKKAIVRPTQIGDFGDQLGPDPMRLGQLQRPAETVVARRRSRERHFFDRQRLKALVQRRQRLLAHARADAASVNQPSIRLEVAQQQRADIRPRSLRVRPSDDDELGAVEAFGLDPCPTVARQIGPVEPLGDDPFEPVLARRPPENLAVAAFVIAEGDPVWWINEQSLETFLRSQSGRRAMSSPSSSRRSKAKNMSPSPPCCMSSNEVTPSGRTPQSSPSR